MRRLGLLGLCRRRLVLSFFAESQIDPGSSPRRLASLGRAFYRTPGFSSSGSATSFGNRCFHATVKLLGFWLSPYSVRVIWTLKLKGIEYEYIEEDLQNKSPLLLKYNPVHKKIPALVHGGKPIAESLIIIEYLDETWKQNPILPEDPYERAQARFWAKFADEKCVTSLMSAFTKKGEEKEKAAKEARENLKILESGLGEKQFFGGESIGFVDIAAGWIGVWARIAEEIAEIKLIDTETMPLLDAWFGRVLQHPVLKECLPPQDRLLEHCRGVHKRFTAGSS